jgi:hypothetical protein
MWSNNKQTNGKSPYLRSHSARRSRGTMLVITAVVLLFAAGAWVVAYTDALTSTKPSVQTVDPARMNH